LAKDVQASRSQHPSCQARAPSTVPRGYHREIECQASLAENPQHCPVFSPDTQRKTPKKEVAERPVQPECRQYHMERNAGLTRRVWINNYRRLRYLRKHLVFRISQPHQHLCLRRIHQVRAGMFHTAVPIRRAGLRNRTSLHRPANTPLSLAHPISVQSEA